MDLQDHSILAWVGEDELGSGVIGIKIGITNAGFIPLAAMDYHLDKLTSKKDQMEAQATMSGKKIKLVRFTFAEVVMETEAGS